MCLKYMVQVVACLRLYGRWEINLIKNKNEFHNQNKYSSEIVREFSRHL